MAFTFLGRLHRRTKLASGKNGEFWLAVNKRSGSKVAIKKVSKEVFTQEANALMHISHPNVIHLIDSFMNSSPSLIFQYAENGDLLSFLRSKTNTFSTSQLLAVAANIANGMVQLGRCGIIHCDLKARNVLMDSHLCARLVLSAKQGVSSLENPAIPHHVELP